MLCHVFLYSYFLYELRVFMDFLFYSTGLVVSSSTSCTLFTDLAAPAQPPVALSLSRQTPHPPALTPHPCPYPCANSQGCLSSPSQHHSPPLLYGHSMVHASAPLQHPAPVYSSLAPWRAASCLISDCGPTCFPSFYKPATSLPSTFCHYREI